MRNTTIIVICHKIFVDNGPEACSSVGQKKKKKYEKNASASPLELLNDIILCRVRARSFVLLRSPSIIIPIRIRNRSPSSRIRIINPLTMSRRRSRVIPHVLSLNPYAIGKSYPNRLRPRNRFDESSQPSVVPSPVAHLIHGFHPVRSRARKPSRGVIRFVRSVPPYVVQ